MGYFKNITLNNFRNFENYSLNFSKECNVFFGINGCGKTNILEGISLFSKGKGLRRDRLNNLIKKNHKHFSIKSDFDNQNIIYNFLVKSECKNDTIKKIFSVNDDKTKEIIDTVYNLTTFLYFLPETERLFLASPNSRRNFIDQLIFTYNIKYNKTLNLYTKYLLERSKLLKTNIFDEKWLSQLEKYISLYALEIYSFREKQIEILSEYLNKYLNYYNLNFKISIKLNDNFFTQNITEDLFVKELQKNRNKDALIGGSSIGPHKSDYIFYVNEDFLASQLSTGQQKTLILLSYISQSKYLIDIEKRKPILLLDEICSHLDELNRSILLGLVESFNLQIFMTGTSKKLFSFLSTNTNFCNITEK